ncbi:PLP-dependent transferase [bacterium]|nr:PLP-dependent transferase [bacterium]
MAYRLDTLAIHAGQPNDPGTGAVAFPIYQTSTFGQEEPNVHKGFCYARTGNPTRKALEDNLAAIEGARFGLAYASGMAAINGVLATLRSGDHVVSTCDLYGGAWRIFTKLYSKLGIEFSFVDTTKPALVEQAIKKTTKLLWLETPSNPLLKITDIAACAKIAKKAGVTVVVDNTFATPVFQRPLELGADIVLHSTTKYINGHSDVLGGALVTSDEKLHEDLKFFQNAIGAVPGPQDCFLILRGLKTLSLRVERHCKSAERIARFLAGHKKVARVYFPGLEEHEGHAIQKKQATGFGAIVSFELKADVAESKRFAGSFKLWTLAESLGGAKSLLCHPPTMTHASVEPEVRRKVGIADGLIRLAVGLEDVEDLLEDLETALSAVRTTRRRAPVTC